MKASEILAKAYEAACKEMEYFEWSNDRETSAEVKAIYWAICCEFEGKANAYLDCYEMMTGHHVLNVKSVIAAELSACVMIEKYGWDVVEAYMDPEIRESIHLEIAPCTNEEFLVRYMGEHFSIYGEEFEIN